MAAWECFNCGIIRLSKKKKGENGIVCAHSSFPSLVCALPREIIIASEDWSTELRLALNIFLRAAAVSSLLEELWTRAPVNAYAPLALPAATPRFLHMRIAIGPIVFFSPTILSSPALSFFCSLSFISRHTHTRVHRTTSFRSRGRAP